MKNFLMGGGLLLLLTLVLPAFAFAQDGGMAGMPMDHVHLDPSAQSVADHSWLGDLLKVYTPRRICMFYEQPTIWLHVISDFVIAIAYYSIPFAIVYFVRRRRDVAFGSVFWMFAAFILACGTTHVFGVLDVWQPYYRLEGIAKAITASISIMTAIAVWRLMPALLSIPSAAQLETTVQQRTTALEKANIDLVEANSAKARYAAYLQAVVDNIAEGIVTSDVAGGVIDWNPAALQMLGFGSVEEARLSYAQIIELFEVRSLDGQLVSVEQRPLARAMRGDSFSGVELLIRRRDRTGERVISYSAAPVRDAGGTIVQAVISMQDITGRKQAEKERELLLLAERKARAEAENAGRLKDEFLSTLSHELRTPLSAILGWSQLLRSPKLATRLEEGLSVIERNARVQAQLIADLLDMSRIVSGKMLLEMQPVAIADVITASVASIAPAAEAKQITLSTSLGSDLSTVQADPTRLQQVLWNILSNAIKFTPTGGKVRLEARQDVTAGQLRIVVSDNGQGIPSDFLPYVFERFRQLDGSTTRRHGGLGIGLSIVKSIVEAHGGTVTAESAGLGMGATFAVSIPIMANLRMGSPMDSTGAGQASTASLPELTGVAILVVDDDMDSLELAATILRARGAFVLTASNSDSAFDLFTKHVPDILVSDIGMPGEDGYALLSRIRNSVAEKGRNTPAIALTAFVSPEDQQRTSAAGFQSHLSKPLSPDELVIKVSVAAAKLHTF